MPLSSHNKSLIYVSIAVLSWATVATAFKIALRQLSYFELLLIASVTACLFFLVVSLFTGKARLLKELKKKEWMQFASLALLNPVAYYLVLFKAYSLLPAQIAQPINYASARSADRVVCNLSTKTYSRSEICRIAYFAGGGCVDFTRREIFGCDYAFVFWAFLGGI